MKSPEGKKVIRQGDEFTWTYMGRVSLFRRETDDPCPMFESTRIRVTCLAHNFAPGQKSYTFGTEPEWFAQRGLKAAP